MNRKVKGEQSTGASAPSQEGGHGRRSGDINWPIGPSKCGYFENALKTCFPEAVASLSASGLRNNGTDKKSSSSGTNYSQYARWPVNLGRAGQFLEEVMC